MEWREGGTEWLLSFLQNTWSWLVEVFGIIIQNPMPVAIGLASSVFIIMLGLIIGSAIFRYLDSKKSDMDDSVDEFDSYDQSDSDGYSYEYDDSPPGSDRLFERRQ